MINIEACFLLCILCTTLQVGIKYFSQYLLRFFPFLLNINIRFLPLLFYSFQCFIYSVFPDTKTSAFCYILDQIMTVWLLKVLFILLCSYSSEIVQEEQSFIENIKCQVCLVFYFWDSDLVQESQYSLL